MTGSREELQAVLARLDVPGAGVPFFQRLVMRHVIGPFVAARSGWEDDNERFRATSAEILRLAAGLDDFYLQKRVLVPPQWGLEDSSRYWSAVMVLEHLMIVGTGMRDITIRLSQGVVPPGAVDTARVKPLGNRPPQDVLRSYKAFTETVLGQIDAAVGDRLSKTAMRHPWFGPFTARQWHWLLAAHNGLHLRQLREIVARLPARPAAA